jgi:hypothetical protein
MKIQVWNAFASNNSGSYTIVGAFRDVAVAAEVAKEIAAVCQAHSAWLGEDGDSGMIGSPLHAFIVEHGLRWEDGRGSGDDWPHYGDPPTAEAIGHRVIVHAPYTITIPPTFGELIYARGGRVEIELDHAHEPLVVEVGVWWAHGTDEAIVARNRAAVRVAIEADPAVQAALVHDDDDSPGPPRPGALRFRDRRSWMDPAITVGALLRDLITGARAIAAIADAHGARHTLRVFEALDERDPLGYLAERT